MTTNMNELKTLQEEGDKLFDEISFEDLMQLIDFSGDNDEPYRIACDNKIKAFIQQERQKSFTLGMMKGVEMVEGVIRENQKGTFTDDAGHDCWYVDSLLLDVAKLKQELK